MAESYDPNYDRGKMCKGCGEPISDSVADMYNVCMSCKAKGI